MPPLWSASFVVAVASGAVVVGVLVGVSVVVGVVGVLVVGFVGRKAAGVAGAAGAGGASGAQCRGGHGALGDPNILEGPLALMDPLFNGTGATLASFDGPAARLFGQRGVLGAASLWQCFVGSAYRAVNRE